MKLEDDDCSSSKTTGESTGGVQLPSRPSTSGNREMSTSAATIGEVEVKEEPQMTVDLTESSLFDNHVIYS